MHWFHYLLLFKVETSPQITNFYFFISLFVVAMLWFYVHVFSFGGCFSVFVLFSVCFYVCACACVWKDLLLKDEECERLSKVRDQLGQELEELTASLFQVGSPLHLLLRPPVCPSPLLPVSCFPSSSWGSGQTETPLNKMICCSYSLAAEMWGGVVWSLGSCFSGYLTWSSIKAFKCQLWLFFHFPGARDPNERSVLQSSTLCTFVIFNWISAVCSLVSVQRFCSYIQESSLFYRLQISLKPHQSEGEINIYHILIHRWFQVLSSILSFKSAPLI